MHVLLQMLLLLLLSVMMLLTILHLGLILLMRRLMHVMLKMLLRLKQVLLQLLRWVLHLELLRLAMQLHLKLLTKGRKLLEMVVINGNGLMGHWLLCHLVERLADMTMVVHGMLVHLLAHADLVVSMHPNHGILGAEHHGRGAHGDLGQGLPGSRVLGEVHHARLLALRTVSALLLPSCTKVGHSSAAVALA